MSYGEEKIPEMEWEDPTVEAVSRAIFYANKKPLPNDKMFPVWENVSREVRDFVRNQARDAIIAHGLVMSSQAQ